MFTRLLLAAALVFNFAMPLRAESYTQKQLESWVDGLMAEIRMAGADDASHGAVSYDAVSGKFSVADIKIPLKAKSFSDKSSKDSNGNNTVEYAGNPPMLTIARISADRLMQSNGEWSADKLHIENLRIGKGKEDIVLMVDAIDVDAITAPQLAAADFGKTPGEQIATFLQQASMKSVVMPRLIVTDNETSSKASYFKLGEVRISDYVKGKSKQFLMAESTGSIKSASFREKNPDMPDSMDIKIGAMSNTDYDLGLFADILLERPKRAGQKNVPTFTAMMIEGGSVKAGSTFDISYGTMKATNGKTNVPEKGIGAIFTLFAREIENIEKGNATDMTGLQKEYYKYYGDWGSTVETLEWAGMKINSPDMQVELKSATGKDVGSRKVGEMTISGFSLNSPQAKASFESVNLKKIDSAAFTQAILEEAAKDEEERDYMRLEGKLPVFGLVEVKNLTVQSENEPPLLVKRVAFGLNSWVKFIPQHVFLTVENVEIPADALKNIETPNLKDLGYTKLNFSSDTQFNYVESAKTAALAPVKFDFAEAGNIASELRLSDLDATKFTDIPNMTAQLGTAKFDKLMLQLNSGNFFERYIAWKAKAEKKKPEAVREEIALTLKMLATTIPDQAQKKKANDAIDTFVKQPKNLTVVITPKTKITLLDLQLGAMANQAGLLEKVNFDVNANQGGM